MYSTSLVRLGRLYAAHVGISLSTAGRRLANHGAFFDRLESGHTITEARAERVARSLSHHWPVDLPWPPNIPRPAPAPYTSLWRRPAQAPLGGGCSDPATRDCGAGDRRDLQPEIVPVPERSGASGSPDTRAVSAGGPA